VGLKSALASHKQVCLLDFDQRKPHSDLAHQQFRLRHTIARVSLATLNKGAKYSHTQKHTIEMNRERQWPVLQTT
jgi:agmatine/peptidylarginine deiminase